MRNKKYEDSILKNATYLSVVTAIAILSAKLYAWLMTGSVSILASLVDSFLDMSTSLINMIALKFALSPPDNKHRFGHEKIQDLAAFGQGIFFIISGALVFISAIINLGNYTPILNPNIGIYVMIFSIILTFILVAYQTFALSKANSSIIEADKLHYLTDLLSNITVIISIYLSHKYWYLDSVLAMVIASYLCYGAFKLIIKSFKNLIDEEFPEKDKNKVLEVIKKYIKNGEIFSIHDLKTRRAGEKYFIQFHIELDGGMKLSETHKITEKIEHEVLDVFPESEIIIHQDPVGIDEPVSFNNDIKNN